jgi:hypothetical protein
MFSRIDGNVVWSDDHRERVDAVILAWLLAPAPYGLPALPSYVQDHRRDD